MYVAGLKEDNRNNFLREEANYLSTVSKLRKERDMNNGTIHDPDDFVEEEVVKAGGSVYDRFISWSEKLDTSEDIEWEASGKTRSTQKKSGSSDAGKQSAQQVFFTQQPPGVCSHLRLQYSARFPFLRRARCIHDGPKHRQQSMQCAHHLPRDRATHPVQAGTRPIRSDHYRQPVTAIKMA